MLLPRPVSPNLDLKQRPTRVSYFSLLFLHCLAGKFVDARPIVGSIRLTICRKYGQMWRLGCWVLDSRRRSDCSRGRFCRGEATIGVAQLEVAVTQWRRSVGQTTAHWWLTRLWSSDIGRMVFRWREAQWFKLGTSRGCVSF